jgi:hypothetical protein
LSACKQSLVCSNASRTEWQTVVGANSDYLPANLDKSRQKNWILAGGTHLADEAQTGAFCNVELREPQKARVT